MDSAFVLDLLDSVYAAGTAPELWPSSLGKLGHAFGCSCVSLVEKNRITLEGRAAAWGVDDDSQREYLDLWLERNVLHLNTRVWRQGEVETDRDVLPKGEFLRSDYYNGFLKPRDMHSLLRVALNADAQTLQVLALARPRSAGEYEMPDVEQIRPLVRHMQRAATISRHLGQSRDIVRGFSNLLERNGTGIVLLSRNGRVVFANIAARAALAETPVLGIRSGRLTAARRGDDTVLQRLIAGAIGTLQDISAARGGAIRIPNEAGGPGYLVVVGPLDGRKAISDGTPAAFVMFADPALAPRHPQWVLRSLFDLTAAEAATAERLIMGDTPEQAAAALNVKTVTARFHLRSLFRKTNTRRQSELVRLFLSIPAMNIGLQ